MRLGVSCAQSNVLDGGARPGIAGIRNFEQHLDVMVHVENSTSTPDLDLAKTHRKQIFSLTPPERADPP